MVDSVGEGCDEEECCIEVGGVVVLDFEGQEGVVEDSTTNHIVLNLGETLSETAKVGNGA